MVIVRKISRYFPNLCFNDIDYKIFDRFNNYLHAEINPTTGTKLQQVTIHGQIKVFKTLLRQAKREGLLDTIPEYSVPKGENSKEALSEEEVNRIEKMTIENEPILELVRDMFLFSCYTALRFGDIRNLTIDNIRKSSEGLTLHLDRMEKVNKSITIPLYKIFDKKNEKIIEKYIIKNKSSIFSSPTNQAVNRNLKVIKHLCEIKKPLTFHIARHTCLTLVGKLTGNPYLIMKIAEHSDIATSMKYTQGVLDEKLFDLL